MGLFSKKKKDLPFPSQPSAKSTSFNMNNFSAEIPPLPADLNQMPPLPGAPMPDMPNLEQQSVIPAPPSDFQLKLPTSDSTSDSILGADKQLPALEMQMGEKKDLPSFEQSTQSGKSSPKDSIQASASQPNQEQQEAPAGFELPDFDEQELEELEELGVKSQVAVQKQPEEKPKQTTLPIPPKIDYFKPEKSWAKEKFLDVRNFLNIKDDLSRIRLLASSTGEMIEQSGITAKTKDDKYSQLAKELNALQEKMILVDAKLFENE